MNCPYCNSHLPDGTRKCPVCDQPLSAAVSAADNDDKWVELPDETQKNRPGQLLSTFTAPTGSQSGATLHICLLAGITVLLLLLFIVAVWPSGKCEYTYKTVAVEASYNGGNFSPNKFSLESALDENRSWELVSAVPEIETVHPNFGNRDYVTGIKTNTRTGRIILIFRKRL